MEQRRIGTDLVGEIGLGCMGMSWAYTPGQRDDNASIAVIHRAIDLGVTLFDTADVYGPHTNEVLLGTALKGHRDEVFIATKCGAYEPEPGVIARNGNPDYIKACCDASLQRLGVDAIDLFQFHRIDPAVPLEDSWGAFAELQDAGKVRYIGLSEPSVDQINLAESVRHVDSVQSELSLWTRDFLADVIPHCTEQDIAFLAYSPLGRGFLTGSITKAEYEEGDRRNDYPRFAPAAFEDNLRIVDTVKAVAARHGAAPGQVALAWVLASAPNVIPIPGTKREKYLEENVAAATLTLTAQDLAELAEIPSTTGSRY